MIFYHYLQLKLQIIFAEPAFISVMIRYFSSKVILKHSHSEKLFEVIESVLQQASISKNELKAIAVSAGPGSFTGLRIGMSAAKGIAQALSIPIISVPTFEALALQIAQYLSDNSSFQLQIKSDEKNFTMQGFKLRVIVIYLRKN